jgi:hypothetical protein
MIERPQLNRLPPIATMRAMTVLADETIPSQDAPAATPVSAPPPPAWRRHAGAGARVATGLLPALIRRAPRLLLNIVLILVVIVLLLSCWVPGWMGGQVEGDRKRPGGFFNRRPPPRTQVMPAVMPLA